MKEIGYAALERISKDEFESGGYLSSVLNSKKFTHLSAIQSAVRRILKLLTIFFVRRMKMLRRFPIMPKAQTLSVMKPKSREN